MNAENARNLAALYNGKVMDMGAEVYVVLVHRMDGHVIVFTDTQVSHYRGEAAFTGGDEPIEYIDLM